MRQLLPVTVADDPLAVYDVEGPLLRLNMVASLDGIVVDEAGRSGSLGGEGDRQVFLHLRDSADVIMAGAGTVRVEGYGPHRPRRERDPAPIVVVTRQAFLDPGLRVFTEARTPTIVLTAESAPANRVAALEKVADVVRVGADSVDLAAGLRRLRGRGLQHVLCEGGPGLNASLFAAGLVDELCLTLSPVIVGAEGRGRLAADLEGRRDLRLASALEHEGELLLRYVRP